MKLNDLIVIASAAYPDGLIAVEYWDFKRARPRRNPKDGDTLALFVANEIADTYDPDASNEQQIETALDALAAARGDLEAVRTALAGELVKAYCKACSCGRVLVVTERRDSNASGGKSLEFDWKKGAFTASQCLCSFPCPDCGRTVEWGDGSWRIMRNPTGSEPYIWLQEDESEGSADCGCRLVADLDGRGAAMFLCPMHESAPGMLKALTEQKPKGTPSRARKRDVAGPVHVRPPPLRLR